MTQSYRILVMVGVIAGISAFSLLAVAQAPEKGTVPFLLTQSSGQSPGDVLEHGFKEPPDSAKPRVWWHWTNGNVTKAGITKDLEWMKRVGIGGMQLADVAAGGGQTVAEKIRFGTPEWFDAVRYATAEARRLGLEMGIFSSAGWSETGGPWVKPEQAMKKLVWSETSIEGPVHFTVKLLQPPSSNGTFGSLRGVEKGSELISRNGPKGASQKSVLTPFPSAHRPRFPRSTG